MTTGVTEMERGSAEATAATTKAATATVGERCEGDMRTTLVAGYLARGEQVNEDDGNCDTRGGSVRLERPS